VSASAFKQSNGVAETDSLRMRLRTATQTDHDRLEKLMESLDFAVTLENYTSLLLLLLGFHRPLEARLLELDWSETGLDLKERCKSHLLIADLTHLGLDSDSIARVRNCPHLPCASTIPEAVGVLYVLEGSTLGGQLISRRIKSELGVSEVSGGSFFLAYGGKTGEMWRGFIEVLERHGRDAATAHLVEASALQTFQRLSAWIGDSDAGKQC
jgi:heme oxygenase